MIICVVFSLALLSFWNPYISSPRISLTPGDVHGQRKRQRQVIRAWTLLGPAKQGTESKSPGSRWCWPPTKISWVSVWPWTPKNIAIKHRKHLREVLEWMSIGLALGRKRAPADGDSGTMWNSMVESFKVWKRTSDKTNKLIFDVWFRKLVSFMQLPSLKMSGWKTTFTFGMA